MQTTQTSFVGNHPSSPEDVPAHFDAAFNRADVDARLDVFDDAPTMRMTNDQVIEANKSGLRAAFTHQLSARPNIHNVVRCVLRCDDLALVLVDWTLVMRDPEGQEQMARGTATQVMKRQADGSWRLKISNPLGVA